MALSPEEIADIVAPVAVLIVGLVLKVGVQSRIEEKIDAQVAAAQLSSQEGIKKKHFWSVVASTVLFCGFAVCFRMIWISLSER